MNIKFWKKEDDFSLPDLEADFKSPPEQPSFEPAPMGMPGTNNFQTGQFTQTSSPNFALTPAEPNMGGAPGQDLHMELVLARLDSIRNQLETINHRLTNIERKQLEQEQLRGNKPKGPWYGTQ